LEWVGRKLGEGGKSGRGKYPVIAKKERQKRGNNTNQRKNDRCPSGPAPQKPSHPSGKKPKIKGYKEKQPGGREGRDPIKLHRV